jgi:tetratricopeptide (TPR) repeat protein
MTRSLLAALLAATLVAADALAQRGAEAVPPRPALTAGADTNSAAAYLSLGRERLRSNARESATAFYWAYQLDPTSSDALYGRYAALVASLNDQVLVRYYRGDRRTVRSREIVAIDSLYLRALTLDPFLYRQHDLHVFRMYMRALAGNSGESYLDYLLHNGGPWLRGDEAYSQGRFQDALRLYDEALRTTRQKSRLRTERARLFAHVGNHPSALEEFGRAIQEMRREDDRVLVYLYESKALLEHSVGMLHERMGNLEDAREAYGRALTEDLAFYPAHVRMGMLALAAGDTATAVAEMDLAARTAEDAAILFTYGALLASLGRLDEAVAHLDRSIAAAPFYADPWFALGRIREAQGDAEAARTAYAAFTDRAAGSHRLRPAAQQRYAALAAQGTP